METIVKKESCLAGLKALLDKYGVASSGNPSLSLGYKPALTENGETIPLLPWRQERKFTELLGLFQNGTVKDLSVIRTCSIRPAGVALDDMIYRELDLCEFLGQSRVVSVYAEKGGDHAVNLLVRLENGALCTLELANNLPEGAEPIDRHEINTVAGVASDQVVDTQVPQSSVYVYTKGNEASYTDTDYELYGLTMEEAALTRAAFALLKNKDRI